MRLLIALAVSAALLLSGCGTQDPSATPNLSGTGKTADLNFTATTLDGERFDGSTLTGKPAVLWFWAPWCATCRAQSPNVADLAQKYDGRVAVVGVGSLASEDAIDDVASDIPHVLHLVDPDAKVWSHFRVEAQSTYTVIGANGEIVSEGFLDDAELNELVAVLAAEA